MHHRRCRDMNFYTDGSLNRPECNADKDMLHFQYGKWLLFLSAGKALACLLLFFSTHMNNPQLDATSSCLFSGGWERHSGRAKKSLTGGEEHEANWGKAVTPVKQITPIKHAVTPGMHWPANFKTVLAHWKGLFCFSTKALFSYFFAIVFKMWSLASLSSLM